MPFQVISKYLQMLTRILICLVVAGSTHSLSAQMHHEVMVEKQSLATANIRSLRADTDGGNILMEGVTDADARLEVYAHGRGTEEAIKKRFSDYYTLSVDVKSGNLTVLAKRKRQLHRDAQIGVSFRIYVPASAAGELLTSGGNIHCVNLAGAKQRIRTSGGNIAFNDVKGEVSGKTSGGNISLKGCSETFELSTSGGNIDARQSSGKLSLSTSGGNISLEELSGAIKATTSGGNVSGEEIDGSLITSSSGGNVSLSELTCSLEASTSGGNMTIEIDKIVKHVKLRNNGGGNTKVELPASTGMDIHATGSRVKIDRLSAFNGDISEREVTGSINGGGVPVNIDGGASRVTVTLR